MHMYLHCNSRTCVTVVCVVSDDMLYEVVGPCLSNEKFGEFDKDTIILLFIALTNSENIITIIKVAVDRIGKRKLYLIINVDLILDCHNTDCGCWVNHF